MFKLTAMASDKNLQGTVTLPENRSCRVQIFSSEGCRMVDMTCEVHDQEAANTQFITHTVGRVLNEMNVQSTSINTRGYESLLNLVENTANDSFDLYYGLFMYNQVGFGSCASLECLAAIL
jgi:prephenate dehydrogenase